MESNKDKIDDIESHMKLYLIIIFFYLIPITNILFYIGLEISLLFPLFLLISDVVVGLYTLIMYRKGKFGYNFTEVIIIWYACVNIVMFAIFNFEIVIPILTN